jgi:hypothetical protein
LLSQLPLQHLLLNAACHQHAVDPHPLRLALPPHLPHTARGMEQGQLGAGAGAGAATAAAQCMLA